MSNWIKNWFSNMLPLDDPFYYQGIAYNTVENFYQAMKIPPDRLDLRLEIANMNPYIAKKAIRDKNKYQWRSDWSEEFSLNVMRFALEKKFFKGTTWHTKLMETSNEEIVEWNNWGDTFWGKNINTKKGKNYLGQLLMEIRNKYGNSRKI